MNALELVIGNKNYSSWSLRGWLALKATGRAFTEIRLPLGTDRFREQIPLYSPTHCVPVLRHGDLVVWESLAIAEYLAETFPDAALWPGDPPARAHARAISAEMHAGFTALRAGLPMNVRARGRRVSLTPAVRRDVERIGELWRECREAHGGAGPWLFGGFSIADAMYAPVASRFHTYDIDCGALAGDYVRTVMSSAAMREWAEAAAAEPETIALEEVGWRAGEPFFQVRIESLDHLVLTVQDLEATCDFYVRVLGMRRIEYGEDRIALGFGTQKINLHPAGNEFEPKAQRALPGTGDLCFVTETPMEELLRHLEGAGVERLLGPVPRTGARGAMTSVYFRDPDLNLIEVSNYGDPG